MEKNMSQIISVEEMLDALYEKAVRGLSCCKCFVDNRKFIVGGLYNYSVDEVFVYNTEDATYFIATKNENEEWGETIGEIAAFMGCSEPNTLTVSEYAEYWYSRLEPNSNIISDSIKQKRRFFICSYPETFEDYYNPMDETGRDVMLITEFSDDFHTIHIYVHFTWTDAAFCLGESTDAPDLVWNLYCKLCDYEQELQIREREEDNRFHPQEKYIASDFTQVKARFREAIGNAFKSDIGIYSFRFRTNAGSYVATVAAVSSELNEVRVMIHNIDTNQTFTRQVSDRQFFEEIFAVDLFIELFPKEAHALYQEKKFDPKFEKIKEQISDILYKARQGNPSSCSFYTVNKDIPELAEEYSADAFLDKGRKLVHLTVKCPSKKELSYEQTVKVGKPYDKILSGLYRFLYPNRIALLTEDIPTE